MGLFDIFIANAVIDDIVPDITIMQGHRDELAITRHPVEQGAAITDHAFKEPPEIELRIGFSDVTGLNGLGYSTLMYQRLIALQNSRKLINVSTGKRLYSNCLIESIITETAEGYVFSAIIILRLRQVLLARLAVVPVPEKSAQAKPETAAPTTNSGNNSTTDPPQAAKSALSSLFGGVKSLFGFGT